MSARYGGERFKQGLWHFVLGKAVSVVSGFLAMVLVVRLLPVHEFADYSVLVSLVEIFTAVSALGLSHALLRFVPELYVQHYKIALRKFVFSAFVLRTLILILAAGAIHAWSVSLAPIIGLGDFIEAFKLFLLVVIFRTTSHFTSQILESTLHQGYSQLAFSLSSIMRLIGMLYLMQSGQVGLLDVVWVEVISDAICMLAMLAGVVHVVWRTAEEARSPLDDEVWFKRHLRQIVNFALSGYAQHIVGLPFGGDANRLVGGYLFTSPVMASFGFAQSLYEYIKRYLPAQLLVGLIRPVVLARYSEERSFTAVAITCARVILINIAIIGAIFTALAVGGQETLAWISGGKYGSEALWILVALLVVLTLETHRLILEMLVQTVGRYAILIPTNIILSLSIIPAILLFPHWGAIGFPLANALALVFSNLWVKRQLATEGYVITHAWFASAQLVVVMLVAILLGKLLSYIGVHWLLATSIAETVFLIGTWKLRSQDLKTFVADLMGQRELVPEKLINVNER
ncbi:MAG: hypothetical protein HOP04_14320 [Methylophilaceae bacterium]|nr:hypothetical protein [Methylophilaceae bacterium]